MNFLKIRGTIVVKGSLKAQTPPLPVAAPRLKHFQVFFFLFLLLILLLLHFLCCWAAQRSPRAFFFFFCTIVLVSYFFQNNVILDKLKKNYPKQHRFELYLESKKASSAPKRRHFGPICLILKISTPPAPLYNP